MTSCRVVIELIDPSASPPSNPKSETTLIQVSTILTPLTSVGKTSPSIAQGRVEKPIQLVNTYASNSIVGNHDMEGSAGVSSRRVALYLEYDARAIHSGLSWRSLWKRYADRPTSDKDMPTPENIAVGRRPNLLHVHAVMKVDTSLMTAIPIATRYVSCSIPTSCTKFTCTQHTDNVHLSKHLKLRKVLILLLQNSHLYYIICLIERK